MMLRNRSVLVASSAVTLAAAFYSPAYCGWLVFFFLLPIFYGAFLPLSLGFAQGFAWGLIFFALHWYGLVIVFIERAEGQFRLLAPVFLIMYCSLYAGFWFMAANTFSRRFPTLTGRVASWVVATTIYFIVLHRAVFWIFGSLRGYFFALPLLPLAYDPRWLAAVAWLTAYGELVCLIVGAAMMGLMFAHGVTKRRVMVWFVVWLPFAYGWVWPEPQKATPIYLDSLGYVQPPAIRTHPLDCAQAINESLEQLLTTKRNVRCVLMPESSYPFPLNEYKNIIELWSVNGLCAGQKLLIGTHKKEDGYLHNGLLCVTNMLIINDYVKNELFWFTEYVPFPWNHIPIIRNLFLKNKQGFSSTKKGNPPMELLPGLTVRPAVCSELFFSSYPRGPQPLLAAVNDAWFSARYLRELMFLFARFTAIEQNQEIIYVGHERGVWISPKGRVVDL